MRNQRNTLSLSFFLIISFILSSCATSTPVVPADMLVLEPDPQSAVDVPGGLMVLPDAVGTDHPVLVFDFQIQSRLITYGEYESCVEAGVCDPAPMYIHEYAPAGVSWYQAQTYCSYLGGRLPTEGELTRAVGGNEDCEETGGGLVDQEGFGEWVYDWDDPDFYNTSLVSNPFGPMYGDLKVALGLDLDALDEVMYKYFGKYEDAESYDKYVEFKSRDKVEEDVTFGKVEDSFSFYKIEDLKLFAKYDGQYVIKFEDGKFFIDKSGIDQGKWESGEGDLYPRMGILPDQSNPLIGFRCVTQGAALTYAPICKTETASTCSLPAVQMETISAQVDAAIELNPNFKVAGANCPQGDAFDLTISHHLPSGQGVEVEAGGEACVSEEYPGYPDKLFCSCPSPGAGGQIQIQACASDEETLISLDDYCPYGYQFDFQTGGCTRTKTAIPLVYSLIDDGEESNVSTCPGGPGLPVPNYGPLGMALVSVVGVGEGELPDGDQWELFSLSDGSGMCPPGYAFNQDTGCCSPYSEENYDCGSNEYFDAGLKQCLPLGWDGCGPCQELGPTGMCVPRSGDDMLGGRCNVGNEEEVEFDEYGRQPESSEGCAAGAYKDPGLGLCLETRDGCALGYYLDPKTGTCRPISGPESPCPDGFTFNSQTGCCAPSPGKEDTECPEGTEFGGMGCTVLADGCPPTHYYDEETDSCLLREPGECPGGTSLNLIGKCIPDIPGECPDGTEYEPISGACPSGPTDPALCAGDKVFDASLGYCGSPSPNTRRRGEVVIEDLTLATEFEKCEPKIDESCGDPLGNFTPRIFLLMTMSDGGGIYRCLFLAEDKTFQSGTGLCQPDPAGDGEQEEYFRVDIEEGRIASITRTSPDVLDPAEASAPPLEGVTQCYAGYSIGDLLHTDDDEDEDDWSGDPTSGTLPDGTKCQIGFYLDVGALFNLQNCTTMELYVPACGVGPTPEPTDKCFLLTQEKCYTTSGCGWKGICVQCSSLSVSECINAGPGCKIDNNKCVPK